MMGQGTFFDPRLNDRAKFPLAATTGFANKRDAVDNITSKLEALHFYQIAIPPPKPDRDSFDADAARLGEGIFLGKAKCGTCHVPPLFSEPGWAMHSAAELGIDDFQAQRSPDGMYRTTPLRGLFTRAKPGFYHDGRFANLDAVVDHYETVLGFTLEREEQRQLVEYLKSL
jgi:cytochrome c peroxidase